MTSRVGTEIVRGSTPLREAESAGGAAITPDEARTLIHDIMSRPRHDAGGVEAAIEELAGMSESARGGLTGGDITNLRAAAHAEATSRHGALPYADGTSGVGASVYRRHAHHAHNLSDPTDVGRLISRTPQLDNLDDIFTGTTTDADRCGGAALLNAMLLSGDHAGCASALRTVGTAHGVNPAGYPGVSEALSAMESGHLSPEQAAYLQEYAYLVARTFNAEATDRPAVGLSPAELQPFLTELRAHQAFTGCDVELTNHTIPNPHHPRPADEPAERYHWTCTVEGPMGNHSADSWPRTDGYATVTDGPISVPTSRHVDGRATRAALMRYGLPTAS